MLWALLITLGSLAEASGTVLPVAPTVAPGTVAPLPDDPLAEARRRYLAADANGTIAVLGPYLASKASWRQRISGRLLLGRAFMELGHHNLASGQFYRVRLLDHPAAQIAAWYEAVADLERGRPHATIRECEAYREKWPTGHRSDECLVLIGDARAAQGRAKAAEDAYQEYLADPRRGDKLRDEEMRLRTALAWERARPTKAIPLLQDIAVNHLFAATGAGAANGLKRLHEAGHTNAVIPTDAPSRMALAMSLRKSGWVEAAWMHFVKLEMQANEDPQIAAWVEKHRADFARYTRHPVPGTLAEEERYEEDGGATGQRAWTIFHGWRQAGQWEEAAKWGLIGLDKHADDRWWRGRLDDVAQAQMLAGQFGAARTTWNKAVDKRHGSRADARFYRALSTWLAGNAERAEASFTTVLKRGGPWRAAAYYWRAKTREAQGKTEGAQQDRAHAERLDKTGWYGLLMNQETPQGAGWVHRDGTWHGRDVPDAPDWDRPRTTAQAQVGIWATQIPVLQTADGSRAGLDRPNTSSGWSQLSWPMTSNMPEAERHEEQPLEDAGYQIPDGYGPSAHHDPDEALKTLYKVGKQHAEIWPSLAGAGALAEAGLYDESGPIAYAAYAEFRRPNKIRNPTRRAQIESARITAQDWTEVARAAGDHHFATRHMWDASTTVEPEAFDKLRFPVAHARELWPHCQRWGLDPFLVLAIMRQESIYNPTAVSPTGAIGLMQFIKGTGAKISALLDEPLFSPQTLFDPSVNLKYAVYYLRLLNERFNGNFPIAVASYNGGPHHMSRAHRSTLGEMDLDAFVEMIPREEPRSYVKKVVGYYQHYVDLYGPEGARVMLPDRLRNDDATVVDF